ncbi:MAG: transposase [Phycisphaerae bacterium]|nr:transposase [Phycisphaerae bacterium]
MPGYLIPRDAWERIEPVLPRRPVGPKGGRPPVGDREVLTGILFVLKTGIAWEELPLELGAGCGITCLRRIRSWHRSGTWPRILATIEEQLRCVEGVDWERLKAYAARLDAVPGTGRACSRSSDELVFHASAGSRSDSCGSDDGHSSSRSVAFQR